MPNGKLFGMAVLLVNLTSCVSHILNSDGTLQASGVDKVKLADTYVDLAIQYQQRGATQVALERVNLAIKTNPNNQRAHMIRAMIYQQLGQKQNAEYDFKQALHLNMDYAEAYVNYAVFLCAEQRYPEAFSNFANALNNQLYFTPEVAYFSRGNCYLKQDRLDLANQDYLTALRYRNAPSATYIGLARLAYSNKNYELANYYINKFDGSQTSASLWLHILILQAMLNEESNSSKYRAYTSYRNTLGQLLLKNYADTNEAQQYKRSYES